MKAAVLREVNQPVVVEDVQVDAPAPREVLVRTGASGVCHSDLHFVEGLYTTPMPCILGHEAAGTVEAVGEQVSYVRPGDSVIMCLSVFCGTCEFCTRGQPYLCDRTAVTRRRDDPPRLRKDGEAITQFAQLGSYAAEMLVHENALVKVDDDIPFPQLALIGCGATTGLGAVLNTARVEPGSTVAVVGCGGIGIHCVQAAALAGALRIIAVDTTEDKFALAQQFGATDVIDATSGNVAERIMELTGGGVDYSFEAIGLKQTAEDCYNMLRPGRRRHHHRHGARRRENRAGRRQLPAPGPRHPGLHHGLQPLPHRYAPLHRVLQAGAPQAGRTGDPGTAAVGNQPGGSPT